MAESVMARIRARDRATSLINELTAGVVIAGLGALGVFGVVDAITVPGTTSSTGATPSGTTSGSTSTSISTGTGTSTQSGLQPSRGSVSSSSSGSGIVVSGGS